MLHIRRMSSVFVWRRSVRSVMYLASLVGAFTCGGLVAQLSLDPASCSVHQCTQKLKHLGMEDSSSWLSSWSQEHKGPKKTVFLVIVIISAPGNVAQRDAMRHTWLKDEQSDTLHYFVVGTGSLTDDVNVSIQAEHRKYGDLLLLDNIIDSYQALTQKLLASLVYVHYNVKFRFLLKCDDDTYVQIPQLHKELKNVAYKQRLYWGFFDGRATPFRSGAWKETEWVLCDHYLPYALGGGYLVSSDVVTYIASVAKYLKLYKNEDVAMGTWLAPIDLHRVHDPRFDTEYKSRGCNNQYLVTHKQSTVHMREKYNTLKQTGELCREQFQVRKSYQYNWSVPPSKCCVREDAKIP